MLIVVVVLVVVGRRGGARSRVGTGRGAEDVAFAVDVRVVNGGAVTGAVVAAGELLGAVRAVDYEGKEEESVRRTREGREGEGERTLADAKVTLVVTLHVEVASKATTAAVERAHEALDLVLLGCTLSRTALALTDGKTDLLLRVESGRRDLRNDRRDRRERLVLVRLVVRLVLSDRGGERRKTAHVEAGDRVRDGSGETRREDEGR